MNSVPRKVEELGLNASAGHTRKFSGCTRYKTEFGKGKKAIWRHSLPQKGEPHERNPCVSSFEERTPEETSRQADCDSKAAWNLARKYACSKPKTTTSYSRVKAPETQKIVCLLWIRELQCTMLSKEK